MGTKGDTGPAGPRGYPGSKGLTGLTGDNGDIGDAGAGVTITDNGDGTFTVTGSNGSIVLRDGTAPTKGQDYFDGVSGDFVSFVYYSVLNGSPVPDITDGTGSFDGLLESMPEPINTWQDTPDYTDGWTTYVSTNRYKHTWIGGGSGSWVLRGPWSTPKIHNDPSVTNTQFVSYAFIRHTNGVPTTPDGGSYASPVPTTAGWEDGIPAGVGPAFMSKRLFTSDGVGQDASWTVPKLLGATGTGTKHQFGPTNTGPWEDVPATDDEWMVVCTLGSDEVWTCDTANPIKIKGEVGVTAQTIYKAYAFKRSAVPIAERPTGGEYAFPQPVDGVVSGWTENIPSGTANLYISTRMFASDGAEPPQDTEWSESVLFSGDAAIVFRIDSDSQVFAFDENDSNPVPTQINCTALKQGIINDVDWTTVPDLSLPVERTDALDTFFITAAEFGTNSNVQVTATAGAYTDTITILKVKDGSAGPSGTASDTVEVRFQYAPDNNGGAEPTVGWHSKPIVVTDKWLREATFINGTSTPTGTDADYSAGVKFVGDDGSDTYTDFWFSDTGTGNPDTNPADWGQIQTSSDFYVITQTTTNGVTGAWGAVTNIRGEDGVIGKYFETLFAISSKDTAPVHDATTPVYPDYDKFADDPVGWTNDPNLSPTGDEVIWAITATKIHTGELDSGITWPDSAVQWGSYIPVRGTDYNDGTGVYVSKVYKEAPLGSPPAAPTINTGSFDGTDEVMPNGGWIDDPMQPGVGNAVYVSQYIYVSYLTVGVNTWPTPGTWSDPIQYLYIPTLGTDYTNGTPGIDGDGSFHSYIFRNYPQGTDVSQTPPSGGSYAGPGTETLPTNWLDDPTDPDDDEVTWVSERTYVMIAGVWQTPPAWSDPAKYSAMTTLLLAIEDINSIHTDFNGANYTFSNEGGTVTPWFGATPVTTACTYQIAGGAVAGEYHERTLNNLKVSISNANGTEGQFTFSSSGGSWNTDIETFTIICTHTVSGQSATINTSLKKIKAGKAAVQNTANRLDVAYGVDDAGTTNSYPPGADPTGMEWVGTNVVTWIPPATEPAISTTYTDYEWVNFKGPQGIQGVQGPTGPSGAQGVAGDDGAPVVFKGSYLNLAAFEAAYTPTNGFAYYNQTDAKSYVYQDSTWYQMSVDGVQGSKGDQGNPGGDGADGLPIVWKGESSSPPGSPVENWVYKDTDNSQVYIYTGSAWEVMVLDGSDGATGAQGADGNNVYITYNDNALTANPGTPPAGNGNSGIWHTAPTAACNWMSQKVATSASAGVWGAPIQIAGADGQDGGDGQDGLSIIWKGNLASAPSSPVENWVYKNTGDGQVYIYDGFAWELMVNDGTDGVDGAKGDDGYQVYITYNDNAIGSQPSAPTGSGITGGWHTTPSAACNWLSQKVAATQGSGTWGAAILIAGSDGEDGTNGTNGVNGINGTNGNDGDDGAAGLSNRVDFAYANTINGTGDVQYPTGRIATANYSPATPHENNLYMGTNVETWYQDATEPSVRTSASYYEWSRYTGEEGPMGPSGTDALTILNYKPAVSLAANNAGVIADYSQSGTTLSVYEGETKLNYNGAGTTAGTWGLSSINDVNITNGSVSGSGDALVAAHSNMTQDTAFITYAMAGKRINGIDFVAQTTQVFSRAQPGEDAVSVLLTNSSHTIPTDSAGANGDYTDSGTTISLFQGTTQLSHNGSGTSNGTFKVTAAGNNISASSITDSGDNAIMSAASNMTTGTGVLTGTITYTITGKTLIGNAINLTAIQSFNKNLAAVQSEPIINSGGGPTPTTCTHVSVGNPIEIKWSYQQTGSQGTAYPWHDVTYTLYRNGTPIDSFYSAQNLNTEYEPGFGWLFAVSGQQTYVDHPGAGSYTYTLGKSYTWGGTILKNQGSIVTNETV